MLSKELATSEPLSSNSPVEDRKIVRPYLSKICNSLNPNTLSKHQQVSEYIFKTFIEEDDDLIDDFYDQRTNQYSNELSDTNQNKLNKNSNCVQNKSCDEQKIDILENDKDILPFTKNELDLLNQVGILLKFCL